MEYRYRAFLSYSHRDRRAAAWLHRSLENYRMPPRLVGTDTPAGPVPARLAPIFRDREELPASSDLGEQIRAALESSQFLVVVCSPAAAASRWVDQEILDFKRVHGEARILAAIVDGEPYASLAGEPERECFPHALRYRIGPDGALTDTPAEPIAADLRREGDGRRLARLKLIAGLTGLNVDALAQRENQRRVRRLVALATAASIGMVFAIGLALYANARRIEAIDQRAIAEREAATAKAASEFLVGTFALANPETENPRTIPAFTVLERGARRIGTELAGQPVVQARLIDTLGRAYSNLGLFEEARATVENAGPILRAAGDEAGGARLALADAYLQLGTLDRALAITRDVDRAARVASTPQQELRARAAMMEGKIHSAAGEPAKGITALDRSIALYRAAPGADPLRLATALQNRGLLLSDDGAFAKAEASLSEALAIVRQIRGDRHLLAGYTLHALAQNAFLDNKLDLAAQRIAAAIVVKRRMLDAGNPIIADSLSLQGQILQGQGKLTQADAALRSAVAMYRHAFKQPHYQIGITQIYLAMVASDRGRVADALAILEEAKSNYDFSYGKTHANHGDLLVTRATILAKAGQRAEAELDCAAGMKILDDTLGAEAHFTRQMRETCDKL